ncbi:hypothetical protein [Chromobacterium violaceum]|uniref:hypothetical protein n=1 Tax=Chromobacterium violaceum TaxID=536 RepID=UPI001124E194|nr:hypothetical protein [Chromobacterium violaceum]MBA8737226.1 hypothetical protein [Chromobacterium violaceum]
MKFKIRPSLSKTKKNPIKMPAGSYHPQPDNRYIPHEHPLYKIPKTLQWNGVRATSMKAIKNGFLTEAVIANPTENAALSACSRLASPINP